MQPWGIELISIRAQNDMITACLFFSIFLRTDHLDSLPVWGVTDPTWPWCVLSREGSCDSRCGHAPKADQSSRTLKVSCCTWADWQEVGRLPPQSSTPERKIDTFPLRLSSGVEKEKNNTNFKKKKKESSVIFLCSCMTDIQEISLILLCCIYFAASPKATFCHITCHVNSCA